MFNKNHHFFILILALFAGPALKAVEFKTTSSSKFPSTIFRAQQQNYTGMKNKSFSESNPGYSGGVAVLASREYFVPYLGLNAGGHAGRQSFLDGADEFNSIYTYQYVNAEAGLYLFPMGREKRVNIYFNGGGLLAYQSMTLKTNTTLATLTSKSEQTFSTGYKGNVGFEWILNKRGSGAKWTFYTEVGFKKESAKLFKQTFTLDSLTYTFGLGW